jgi:hypothetical protein
LVVLAEDLLDHPQETLARVHRFAGLEPMQLPQPVDGAAVTVDDQTAATSSLASAPHQKAVSVLQSEVVNAAGPLALVLSAVRAAASSVTAAAAASAHAASTSAMTGSATTGSTAALGAGLFRSAELASSGVGGTYGALRCAASAVDPELIAEVKKSVDMFFTNEFHV